MGAERYCPTCGKALPLRTRARFCPVCALRGTLDLPEPDGLEVEPPQFIGDYELLERIGRGGMGVVYRAVQRRLGRVVAVKLLAGGTFAGDAERRRFQAEAEAAARLRHPQIVTVYEIGEHAGQPYYSMELVEGLTLAEQMRDGPLEPREAAGLLRMVADAVQHAHEQGVLHRDLKPSNIFLDAARTPRVGDFGLARRMDSEERLTLSGDVLGTPAYLAPEQARGDRGGEGAHSDVYSMGAILYHLLCGRPPFQGGTPQEVLRQVMEMDPVAPARLNPAVPADLETICLKSLEKSPARRYRTAAELSAELGRFLANEPVLARPVGSVERVWRWSQRHPARAGLALTLLALLAVLLVVPSAALLRVSRAELAREAQLRETLVSQARAVRLGGRSGQRVDSLAALERAATLERARPLPELAPRLRREFIASLALDDVRVAPAPDLPGEPETTYLAMDRTGRFIARGQFRGALRLLERGTGVEVLRVELGQRTLQHVLEFSPTGRYLAVRHGGEIAVWDLTNRAVAVSQPSWLNRFSFHPDGGSVAFLRTNSSVACFALPDGRSLWQWLPRGLGARGAIAFAPDGKRLAWGAEDGTIELRASESGQLEQTLRLPEPVAALAWSPDGAWLAAGGEGGHIHVWELELEPTSPTSPTSPPGPGRGFEAHAGVIRTLAFSPDSRRLLSAGHDEMIRVIDVRTGRAGPSLAAVAFQFAFPDGGAIAGPIWQGGGPLWLALTNSDIYSAWRLEGRTGSSLGVALDHTAGLVAATREDHVRVWELPSFRAVANLPAERSTSVYFEPDGALLAVGHQQVSRWRRHPREDGRMGYAERESLLIGRGGEMAAFNADGTTMALADYRNDTATILPALGGPNRLDARFKHERIAWVALSPDGRWLVSGAIDRDPVRIWDTTSGQAVRQLIGEGDYRAIFSPDGRWLLQHGLGARLWMAGSWEPGPPMPSLPRNAALGGAAFSPDGALLAISAGNQEIHVLRFPERRSLAVLESPSALRINRLAWSGDGSHLIAATAPGEIQIWHWRRVEQRLREWKVSAGDGDGR